MPFNLRFTLEAQAVLKALEGDASQQAKLKKVRKALRHLELDPRYPGLHSHLYETFPIDRDVKVWDSYVENRTPSAWRIFWRYGPEEPEVESSIIMVLAITPHP